MLAKDVGVVCGGDVLGEAAISDWQQKEKVRQLDTVVSVMMLYEQEETQKWENNEFKKILNNWKNERRAYLCKEYTAGHDCQGATLGLTFRNQKTEAGVVGSHRE